jgi:hypothetical protein
VTHVKDPRFMFLQYTRFTPLFENVQNWIILAYVTWQSIITSSDVPQSGKVLIVDITLHYLCKRKREQTKHHFFYGPQNLN